MDFFKVRGKELFKRVEILDICNEQATKEAILSKLSQLENTQNQDAVLLYLSGHGESLNDRRHFIPYDVVYPEREERVKEKGISSDELSGCIKRIKARKVLVLLDACKSGAGRTQGLPLQRYPRLRNRPGYARICSILLLLAYMFVKYDLMGNGMMAAPGTLCQGFSWSPKP